MPRQGSKVGVGSKALVPRGGTGGHSLASVWSGGQRLRAKCRLVAKGAKLLGANSEYSIFVGAVRSEISDSKRE